MYFAGWLIFSLLLLFFSFLRKHPYRFPRFLAFESIVSLIFIYADTWFRDPISWNHLLSWLFLIGPVYLMGHGFYLIKKEGYSARELEDTSRLITSGPYRIIRHPLFTSSLLLSLGVFFKDPRWIGILLFGATILGAVLTANIEEGFNLERFGTEYPA